ncbi:Uncharacterized protein conserved in bacteria [Klebsiella pneumoniae]|uniref:Uncharacterized protein conserved in bacteria n=1 Tax=Klebsiella pneumoniae TaxID=573 RepID=A0A377YT92_KLEPN|nr:Uncharacterized protein conserved in bacteria [Klebsiella pneumoniae]
MNPCSSLPTRSLFGYIPKRSASVWMPVAGGFLLFLEQIQVLNLETREMVIERVLALDTAEFELEDLKWVILMVLFNIPGCENAYQQMEELLFEVNEGMLH